MGKEVRMLESNITILGKDNISKMLEIAEESGLRVSRAGQFVRIQSVTLKLEESGKEVREWWYSSDKLDDSDDDAIRHILSHSEDQSYMGFIDGYGCPWRYVAIDGECNQEYGTIIWGLSD